MEGLTDTVQSCSRVEFPFLPFFPSLLPCFLPSKASMFDVRWKEWNVVLDHYNFFLSFFLSSPPLLSLLLLEGSKEGRKEEKKVPVISVFMFLHLFFPRYIIVSHPADRWDMQIRIHCLSPYIYRTVYGNSMPWRRDFSTNSNSKKNA